MTPSWQWYFGPRGPSGRDRDVVALANEPCQFRNASFPRRLSTAHAEEVEPAEHVREFLACLAGTDEHGDAVVVSAVPMFCLEQVWRHQKNAVVPEGKNAWALRRVTGERRCAESSMYQRSVLPDCGDENAQQAAEEGIQYWTIGMTR